MLANFILFLVGFYILIKGSGFLIDGASSLSRKFNIPPFVIGLVIVGIGTSIPEFAVTFIANLTEEQSIGLGTVIGSNIFNLLFILGAVSVIFPIAMKSSWVFRDLTWNMVSVFLVTFVALPFGDGEISRMEGLFLLAVFFYWLYTAVKKSNNTEHEEIGVREIAFPLAAGLILAGFAGVFLGGKWVVDGAVEIAKDAGLSEALIGITIVSMGTSIPELSASLAAAYKKQPGIAVGNIIGSNIFDFLMILGAAALFKPVNFPADFATDMKVILFSVILLFAFMFVGEKYAIKRWKGAVFVLAYLVYIAFLIIRA